MAAFPSMRFWTLGCVVAMCVVSASARAQVAGTPSEAPRAAVLFQQGKDAMAAGKLAEACTAFDESYRLEPRVTTLANLANCREKNQQLATAVAHFTKVAGELRDTTDPGGVQLRDVANQRVAVLAQRLSRLELRVATPDQAGLEILRNGEVIPPGRWREALPVDGGEHELVARAPGHVEWTAKIIVAVEGDVQVVAIPALEAAAAEVKVSVTAPTPEPTEPRRQSLVLPVSLGVAAVVLGGAALGLDYTARALAEDADRRAAASVGVSDPRFDEARRLNSDANSRRDLAQGIGVAAGVCAGAAIVTYFVGRSRASSSSHSAARSVSPLVGAGVAGLSLGGSF